MIAALYALDTYPDLIHRIAIVDIGSLASSRLILDIHHGNGTEQILKRYNHPEKIMFWSSHIYFNVCPLSPLFPRTRTMTTSSIREPASLISSSRTFTTSRCSRCGKRNSRGGQCPSGTVVADTTEKEAACSSERRWRIVSSPS